MTVMRRPGGSRVEHRLDVGELRRGPAKVGGGGRRRTRCCGGEQGLAVADRRERGLGVGVVRGDQVEARRAAVARDEGVHGVAQLLRVVATEADRDEEVVGARGEDGGEARERGRDRGERRLGLALELSAYGVLAGSSGRAGRGLAGEVDRQRVHRVRGVPAAAAAGLVARPAPAQRVLVGAGARTRGPVRAGYAVTSSAGTCIERASPRRPERRLARSGRRQRPQLRRDHALLDPRHEDLPGRRLAIRAGAPGRSGAAPSRAPGSSAYVEAALSSGPSGSDGTSSALDRGGARPRG